MDQQQQPFQTVDVDHRNKAPCNVHNHHYKLTDHFHQLNSPTGPIAPPLSGTSSSTSPQDLWHASAFSSSNAAAAQHQQQPCAPPPPPPPPPSSVAGGTGTTASTSSVSCSSTPTHTVDHHSSTTFSSPASFESNNASHSSVGQEGGSDIFCANNSGSGSSNHHNHNQAHSQNASYIPIAGDHTHFETHPRNHSSHLLLQGLSCPPPPPPPSSARYAPTANFNIHTNFTTAFTDFNTFAPPSLFSHHPQQSTAAMHPTTGIVVRDADLDTASYYCFDRGNGQFTPLIPLDQIPAVGDILGLPSCRMASDANMIVLPAPRLGGESCENQALSKLADLSVTPPTSPHNGGDPTDLIQSRIDNIVAQAPDHRNAMILVRNNNNNINTKNQAAGGNNNAVVPFTGNGNGNGGGKREKIYCDKWIHDGTCAFTQQGCKFKHEMPGDREVQQSLGLFHGYPAWWKKKCAEENMFIGGGGGGDAIDRPVHVNTAAGGSGAYRSIVGRLTSAGTAATSSGAAPLASHHQHNTVVVNTHQVGNALASNNWRQRGASGGGDTTETTATATATTTTANTAAATQLGSPHSPENYGATTPATTPLSAGSNGSGSGDTSRTTWQPRGRVVGGNIQGRGTVVRYNMPHFPQPNFGPIAPPSQTVTGFNNNNASVNNAITGRGGGNRRNTNNDNNKALASPINENEQQQHIEHSSMPGGHRRTGGVSLPLRSGGFAARENGGGGDGRTSSSEDSTASSTTLQNTTDEMGNVRGVKL